MQNKVSIFIPVYNTERFIGQAIESILEQTYTDLELVVLDDCSTDNTFSVCQKYAQKDNRIKLYRNDKNLGMMANWNHGLTLCGGEYWGKLDADDYWDKNMVADCVKVLDQHSEVGMVCSRFVCVDEGGAEIEGSELTLPEFARNKSVSFVDIVRQDPEKMFSYHIAQQGVGLIRRKIFDELGYFKPLNAADTEMWFRIGCHYSIYSMNKLFHYRRIWEGCHSRRNVIESGRAELYLYEVRKAILEYYFENHRIDPSVFKTGVEYNEFEYLKHLAYKAREGKKYGEMLRLYLRLFKLSPVRAAKYYYDRLRKRIYLWII